MWASVPHNEAARTRIRTSSGPEGGIGTSAHSRAPALGANLRTAFIDAGSFPDAGPPGPSSGGPRGRRIIVVLDGPRSGMLQGWPSSGGPAPAPASLRRVRSVGLSTGTDGTTTFSGRGAAW